MRRRALLWAGLALACRNDDTPPIRIVLGPAPEDEVSLVPRAALAEYIEVSPSETHLLLRFSSSARDCEGVAPPEPDAVTLSVRILLAQGERLEPGSFPLLSGSDANGVSHATSTVKLKGRRRELLPGGSVELGALDLNPEGSVEGTLKLEFPGDHRAPATRVSGRFKAYFCRINRLR